MLCSVDIRAHPVPAQANDSYVYKAHIELPGSMVLSTLQRQLYSTSGMNDMHLLIFSCFGGAASSLYSLLQIVRMRNVSQKQIVQPSRSQKSLSL